jgi:DNA-binding NtrC family response regulator
LKNITEQMSLLEENRIVSPEALRAYLPTDGFSTNGLVRKGNQPQDFSEREVLYKVLFEMKNELNDLKQIVFGLMQGNVDLENVNLSGGVHDFESHASPLITVTPNPNASNTPILVSAPPSHEIIEETLSLMDTEKEMIKKALLKHKSRRRNAAKELGISERTLYRKIKEYDLNDL